MCLVEAAKFMRQRNTKLSPQQEDVRVRESSSVRFPNHTSVHFRLQHFDEVGTVPFRSETSPKYIIFFYSQLDTFRRDGNGQILLILVVYRVNESFIHASLRWRFVVAFAKQMPRRSHGRTRAENLRFGS